MLVFWILSFYHNGYLRNLNIKFRLSLFDLYDFSIIPIEFISSIYERFIGSENQAIKGAYYTPLFLVDFIEKETIGNYFQNNKEEFNCRVLDPACGSGAFPMGMLQLLIKTYERLEGRFDESDALAGA